MSTLVKVENLYKEYPVPGEKKLKIHAVTDVSLEVERDQTLALVGESGSGKTTVGKCLLRLEEVTKGKVYFDNQEIANIPYNDMRLMRKRMQMVFQEPYGSLNPRISGYKAIEEPMLLLTDFSKDEIRDQIYELAEVLDLTKKDLSMYPHELTGGKAQKVCIARAMITKPDFVVHDEPTSFLDITSRAEILTQLIRLQAERNLAYVYISHDMTTVKDISSHVAVMYLSKIIEIGPKDEIFNHHIHPYTKALLSSVLFPDPTTRRSKFRLIGEIPSPIKLPTGCALHKRCPIATPLCAQMEQQLVDIGSGHKVACHIVTKEHGGPVQIA